MTKREAWRRALVVAAAVVVVDQVVKAIATAALDPGERVRLVLGIDLANVRNRGVAFGLLADGRAGVVLITVVATALMIGYFARRPTRPGLWLAAGLLTGGALGNLADRIRIDAVVDYFDPPWWPAFNLADACIVAGVIVLLFSLEVDEEDDGAELARSEPP